MGQAAHLLLTRRGAWIAGLSLGAVTIASQLSRLSEPDIAYMLYAAGRVLDGARLYRDVVDINPPPIFAINIAVAWLARITGLSDILLYRLATGLAQAVLLLLVNRLLASHVLAGRDRERRYVVLALCFALFPLSREDFGQREHLVLGLLLPYLTLAVARVREQAVGIGIAVLAGALAGLAIALKPPFGLAWVGVEGWRVLTTRRLTARTTPELITVVVVGLAYALAVAALTPEYPRILALLGPAYRTYLRVPYSMLLLFAPGAALTAFAMLGALAVRKVGRDGDGRALLAVATAGCFLAGVVQAKGLRYHFYPSLALATVLVAIIAAEGMRGASLSGRLYSRVSTWLCGAIVAVVLLANLRDLAGGTPTDRRRRVELMDLVDIVRAKAPTGSVGMLSYHMGSAFPLINYAGVRLASRFPCLWLLPASYWTALTGPDPIRYHRWVEMPAPERMLNEAVKEDLLEEQPRLLLILRPFPDRPPYGFRRLNYVAYFGRQPGLAQLFAGYQLIATKGQYDVYERLEAGAERTGPAPSVVVPPLDTLTAASDGRPRLVDPELMAGIGAFGTIAAAALLLRRRSKTYPASP